MIDQESELDNCSGSENSNSFCVQPEKLIENKKVHLSEKLANKIDQESEIDHSNAYGSFNADSVDSVNKYFEDHCIPKVNRKDWKNIDINLRKTLIKYFENDQKIKQLELENNANKEFITNHLIDSFKITSETIKNDVLSDKFKTTGTLVKRLSALIHLSQHKQETFYSEKNNPYNDINDFILFFQYNKIVKKKDYYGTYKHYLHLRKKTLHSRYQRNWHSLVNNIKKQLCVDLTLQNSLKSLSQKQSQILSSNDNESELNDSELEGSENFNSIDNTSTQAKSVENHLNSHHLITNSPRISDQHITNSRPSEKNNIEERSISKQNVSFNKEITISNEHINDDQDNSLFKCCIINCINDVHDRCFECEGESKFYCTEHLEHDLHHKETSMIEVSKNNSNESINTFIDVNLQNNDVSNEDEKTITKRPPPVKIFYYLYIIVCANFGVCKVGATSLATYKIPCEFNKDTRINLINSSLLRRYKTSFGMMKEYLSLTTFVFEIEELEAQYTNNQSKDLNNCIWRYFEILFRLVVSCQ
jgi:hypothetical protein